jgi:hypothetical protein
MEVFLGRFNAMISLERKTFHHHLTHLTEGRDLIHDDITTTTVSVQNLLDLMNFRRKNNCSSSYFMGKRGWMKVRVKIKRSLLFHSYLLTIIFPQLILIIRKRISTNYHLFILNRLKTCSILFNIFNK